MYYYVSDGFDYCEVKSGLGVYRVAEKTRVRLQNEAFVGTPHPENRRQNEVCEWKTRCSCRNTPLCDVPSIFPWLYQNIICFNYLPLFADWWFGTFVILPCIGNIPYSSKHLLRLYLGLFFGLYLHLLRRYLEHVRE